MQILLVSRRLGLLTSAGFSSSRQVKGRIEHPHATPSRVGSKAAREFAVHQLRSLCRLPARSARVSRVAASFSWLPPGLSVVANSAHSTGILLRQVQPMARGLVQASLPLRTVLRSVFSMLPGNNQNNFAPCGAGRSCRGAGFYGR